MARKLLGKSKKSLDKDVLLCWIRCMPGVHLCLLIPPFRRASRSVQ